jgi:ketosteroid isomerase-like protein
MYRVAAVIGVLMSVVPIAACTRRPGEQAAAHGTSDQAAVDAGLHRYSELVLAMDHAGIAALFAPEGEIVNRGAPAIHGRSAIDSFLVRFSGYRVLENHTIPAATSVLGDSAVQVGAYEQRVRTPQGDTLVASGSFRAVWQRSPTGGWLILRMSTAPAK